MKEDPNGKIGYYVGPAINHYLCFKCFIPKTKTEIITDIVDFILDQIPIPSIYLSNYIYQAPSDIVTLLACPPKTNLSPMNIKRYNKKGLLQLSSILNHNEVTPTLLLKKKIT